MNTEFVTTKPNQDSITLSVDVKGRQASTSLFLNGNLIKTLDDNFSQFLGTNQGLRGNNLLVVTQVARWPADLQSCRVDFLIEGAADVQADNPVISNENFNNGASNVPHVVNYYFI